VRGYQNADLATLAETALDAGATLTVRCAAYQGGRFQGYFDLVSGSVDVDEQNSIRGRCRLQVQRDDFADPDAFDPGDIDVDSWRIQIDVGVVLPTDVAYVTVGTFVVWDVERNDDQTDVISIQGQDVTALIRQARLETLTTIAAGTNYATAISGLISVLNIPVSLPTTGFTTPLLVFEEGSDRLDAANSMAGSVGWELVADTYGGVTGRVIPGSTGTPLVEFVEGASCRMQAINKKRTRDQVYNIAIVEGQPAGGTAPVRGTAYDDNPLSPTYVTATSTFDFGRAPVWEKSQFIVTSDQATDAAVGLLRRKRGIGSQLKVTHVRPDFRLEPSDLVRVVRSRLGVDTVVPVRSTSLNLDANNFTTTIQTREVLS